MADEAVAKSARGSVSNFIQKNAVGVAIVLAALFLIVPMPRALIDVAMGLNFALSVVILLTVVYTPRATNFTTFPRVILFATLIGLGINISSTRLILSQSAAAKDIVRTQSVMVQAFANIVTGGGDGPTPVVLGFVIFIILIVVQVVVITKGATRVSEVAARFSLDSMNSKMFDVESQLNSGAITEEEAREQKKAIRRESDFYSTMDGASKFVSGNVKAGIFITVVNLVGGIIVGAVINKMSMSEAMLTYTKLTIGDGLLSQMPSIMLSFATGLIVTGSSTDEPVDEQIKREFSISGRVYQIVGGAFALMGLAFASRVPSATVLLVLLGAVLFYVGFAISRSKRAQKARDDASERAAKAQKQQGAAGGADSVAPLDALSLELGYALIPLVEKEKGAELLERITRIRREAALDMGLVVPPIRIVDNVTLNPNEYSFKIQGIEAGRSAVRLGYYMCMANGGVTKEMQGEKTKDPAFGMDAIWLPEEKRAEAEKNGYTVIDPPTIIATHITEIIRNNAAEILGRKEVAAIISKVKENDPVVVEEVMSGDNKFTYGDIEKIFRALLQERVSIRNVVVILETMANCAPITRRTWDLVEKVREALGLQICKQYADDDGALRVMSLSQDLSQLVIDHVVIPQDGSEPYVALDPVDARMWSRVMGGACSAMRSRNCQPVVYCASVARRLVWSSLESQIPDIVAVSDREILAAGRHLKVESLGEISRDE